MGKKVGRAAHILDRLKDRIGGPAHSTRRDLNVVAYNMIDGHIARLVATYVGDPPDFEGLRAWAIDFTKGKMKAVPGTMYYHDTTPYPFVSFIVEANRERKPLEETLEKDEGLVPVTATRFLDVNLGTTWDVEEINGTKFLVRVQPDGLKGALEGTINYKGPKTWKAAKEILSQSIAQNDLVRYLRPDLSVGVGSVLEVMDVGTCKIKDVKTKDVFERSTNTVLEILPIPSIAEMSKEELKKVRDYLAQYLGTDLAKEITS